LFPPVVAISAGPFYTVALKADGTGWAWGWNYYGQLGNNTTDIPTSNTPIQVQELVGASKVAAGGGHVLALVNPRDSVTPTTINFGSVPVGTSVCHTVSVSNGGDDGLLLNAISVTGADASQFSFSWGFLPISIPLNTTLPVPVCFNPTATGARNAAVVFDDYGFNGPHTVAVSGTGYIPADLTVTQSVVLSGRRLTYTINVRNNGPGLAPSTTLSDPIPAQTQLVGIAGTGCHTSILGKTTCEPFDLPSGGLATFTLVVDITATAPAQITNIVSVSSGVPDPNTRDNVSRLVTNWSGK
jgi:uncharacterized repeat protein (TIGR01451 family)